MEGGRMSIERCDKCHFWYRKGTEHECLVQVDTVEKKLNRIEKMLKEILERMPK